MTKSRVLVITYWYPPMMAMGAVRLANLVSRLSQFGWEPVVVTVAPLTDHYMRAGTLCAPEHISVYRTKDLSLYQWVFRVQDCMRRNTPKTSARKKGRKRFGEVIGFLKRWIYRAFRQLLCFPDECILWRLMGYGEIRQIAQQVKPQAILSSSLPNTTHLIAQRLSQDLGIPWVAEFRDLWTQNHLLKRTPPLRWIERGLERRVIRGASALVTVSPFLAEQLEVFHRKPVYVIPNGFSESALSIIAPPQANALTITYTGMIYPGKRDPQPLFQALTELLQDGALSDQEVEVCFYGRKLEHIERLLEQYPRLASMINLLGEVPHEEALRHQRNSTVLLLLEWTDPRAKGVYTGKVFEYLGARRPILAVGPKNGVMEELLNETKAGVLVSTAGEVKTVLAEWLEAWREKGNVPFHGDEQILKQHTWENRVGKLADVLERVVSEAGQ